MSITSINRMSIVGNGNTVPPQIPQMSNLGSLGASELRCAIELFEVTSELVTIDGVQYRKVNSYLSSNFDASVGWKIWYSNPLTGDLIKIDDFEEIPNFTLNGSRPSHSGEVYNYCYKNVLYFPSSLTSAFAQAHMDQEQGEVHQGVSFQRKGSLRINDYVVTDVNDVVKTAIEVVGGSTTVIDLTTPTDATTEKKRVAEAISNLESDKQEKLSVTQLAAANSGITSTKLNELDKRGYFATDEHGNIYAVIPDQN